MSRLRRAGKSFVGFLLRRAGAVFTPSRMQAFIFMLIKGCLSSFTPEKALRFLFLLDNKIYALEGALSVSYGGGLHTKHRHTRYHDFFVRRVNKSERVLDIGCGNGSLSFDIATRSGAEVVAVDLVPENIHEARTRFAHPKVTYLVGDVMQDVPQGTFDVIVLSNVLEHLSDRRELLARINEKALPSRWLIRVPLFERDWRVPLKKELGVEWRLDPTHETEYTAESFSEEMKAANLRIVQQEVRWGEIWAEVTHG